MSHASADACGCCSAAPSSVLTTRGRMRLILSEPQKLQWSDLDFAHSFGQPWRQDFEDRRLAFGQGGAEPASYWGLKDCFHRRSDSTKTKPGLRLNAWQ